MSGSRVETAWSLLTEHRELSAIAGEWHELYNTNPAHSPFQAWAWVTAWLTHLADDHELRFLTLRSDEGELQLIVPLVRVGGGVLATDRLVLAGGYGPECSDYLGCLFHPALVDQLPALVTHGIHELLPANARVSLPALSADSGLPARLDDAFSGLRRRAKSADHLFCPRAELAAEWDSYLQTLSANFRSQVRRHYKRIRNSDQCAFRRVPAESAEAFTRQLVDLNRTRIAAKGDTSSLEDARFRAFMLEAVPGMARAGIAWMDVIEDGAQTIGATLNFVHGQVVYYYMGGFDDSASRLRPGTALFAHVIRRSIELGYRYYDFLRGDESYKYRWGARDVVLQRIEIYPAGALRSLASVLVDGSRATLVQQARRFAALTRTK